MAVSFCLEIEYEAVIKNLKVARFLTKALKYLNQ
jgi:hypothetical protein